MKLIYIDEQDKRLFRLFLACVILLFISIPFKASAESGTLELLNTYSRTFTTSGSNDGAATPQFTTFVVSSSEINQVSQFYISFANPSSVTWAHDAASTTFTITSCGSGSGLATYSKSAGAVAWYFNNPSFITCSPLVLTYQTNIFNDLSASWMKKSSAVGIGLSSTPFYVRTSTGDFLWKTSAFDFMTYISTTENLVTNNYTITYPQAGFFNTSIDKTGATTNTKVLIQNASGSPVLYPFQVDNSFNTLSGSVVNPYHNGISLNITDSAGDYHIEVINTTGSPIVFPTPTPTPTINSLTMAGIVWNKNNYTPNEIGTITYLIDSSILNFAYNFNIRITNSSGELQRFDNLDLTTLTGQVQYQFKTVGTYTATFYKTLCILGICSDTQLDQKTVTVSLNPSYITINSPVIAGVNFNASYIFGNSVLSQGELNAVIIEQYTDGGLIGYSTTSLNNYNIVVGTSYNVSLIVGQARKYKASLFDISRGRLASTIFDAVEGFIPPQLNITTSKITTDKTTYFTSDSIIMDYQIDNTNYSNGSLSKYLTSRNYDRGFSKVITPLFSQTGTFELPLTSGSSGTSCSDSISCFITYNTFYPGANALEIHGKTNNSDIIIAFANFTISFIDAEGYGISSSKLIACLNEPVTITVSSPDNSTVRITEYSNKANGIVYSQWNSTGNNKTYQKIFVHEGSYTIDLIDGSGNTRRTTYIKIDNSKCVTPQPTGTSQPPGTEKTSQMVDALTSTVFLSLIFTAGLMIAIAWKTRQGLPTAIIGIASLGVFTFITWFPAWIFFSVIIITALLLASKIVLDQMQNVTR